MVGGHIAPRLFIVDKQGPIHNPKQVIGILIHEPQLPAEQEPEPAQNITNQIIAASHDQYKIANFGSKVLGNCFHFFLFEELGDGRAHLPLLHRQPDQALGAPGLSLLAEAVDLPAGEAGPALDVNPPDYSLSSCGFGKDPELAVLEGSGQIMDLQAKTGIGLVRAEPV